MDCPDIVKDLSKIPYLFRNYNAKMNNFLIKVRQFVELVIEKHIPVFGISIGVQFLTYENEDILLKNPIKKVGLKNDSNAFRMDLIEERIENAIFKEINGKFIILELYSDNF